MPAVERHIGAAPPTLTLAAIPGLPLVKPGDDLGALCIAALERVQRALSADDILVVAQKIVSKAEGRYVDLAAVAPSPRARELSAAVGKDPRLVEVILSESTRVVRYRPGVLITSHRLGFVMANAGVDQSNVEPGPRGPRVLLLPRDPDATAHSLRERIGAHFGTQLGLVITDSFGRPWRYGTVGVAIGAAGIPALIDERGRPDLYGRPLRVTQRGFADEIAAGAALLMGQADEGTPLVLVNGLGAHRRHGAVPVSSLVRSEAEDLFP
ncbi:MAG: coenzyme F420-0:L-glutamate ligase [Gammaproteobacteria bacterium]|nr:coenzyme F420-0:L-glutamate ligase [Gammaproteobacteria bacterium]NIR84373.1 coenzyme F420-0:L-glutamate ligase [Gammaproteobacteria bacterium]NIR90854.1 coenzyme F420-0:L-glutamate ligase [Gammaproteobacteria bacterium]NIU07040.1 coenzyme F420-0:L-glutamate ligase [Gammaproteobacteria bacterium]NIV76169.1 coenzyme F420-0:L-glutamate ligase [Gammaproteobacteria bacterium]